MASRRLTIYIDGRCLLRPRDGVGSYAATLLTNVLAQDSTNNYIAIGFADQKQAERLVAETHNFRYHFLPFPRKAYMGLFRLWQLPVDAWLPEPADIVWYPDFVAAPWVRAGKKAVTIADLTFLNDSSTVEPRNVRYLQRFVPQAVRRAQAITTVSHAVAKEIAEQYNPTIPIEVFYPAPPPEQPGVPNTKDPYILFVSTIQPRKNVATLLRAYAMLPNMLRAKYRLVLAGRKGWNMDAGTNKLLQDVPHTFIDGPTDAERDALYAGASLFVLPSLREGFGIPAVEALAHHVPVITSTDPALMEGTGEAALHVPATDEKAFSAAMERVLSDAGLRKQLASKRSTALDRLNGKRNAAAFITFVTRTLVQ